MHRSDTDRAILGVLRCVADGTPHAAWTTAIEAAFPLLGPENRLELGLLALREGALSTERRHGIYSGCSGLAKKGGPYHEVITTYVEPTLPAP